MFTLNTRSAAGFAAVIRAFASGGSVHGATTPTIAAEYPVTSMLGLDASMFADGAAALLHDGKR